MKNEIVLAVLSLTLVAANATSATKPDPVKCGKYMTKVIISEVETKGDSPTVWYKKPNGERAGFETSIADIKKLGYMVGKALCIDNSDLE